MTAYVPRRAFGDVVVELADAVSGFSRTPVRPRDIEFTLPIEAALEMRGETWAFVADMPRTVTRTVFDVPPSRIRVALVAVPTEEGPTP